MTAKPPIYFQYQGHSLTIVGMEVRQDHSLNLVVFDPIFKPSAGVLRFINSSSFHVAHPDRLLRAHRRGTPYLAMFKDFEILKYDNPFDYKEARLTDLQINVAVESDSVLTVVFDTTLLAPSSIHTKPTHFWRPKCTPYGLSIVIVSLWRKASEGDARLFTVGEHDFIASFIALAAGAWPKRLRNRELLS